MKQKHFYFAPETRSVEIISEKMLMTSRGASNESYDAGEVEYDFFGRM